MRSHDPSAGFRSTGTALIRAVAYPDLDLPPWPDLTSSTPEHVASWVEWLRQVWKIDAVAEGLSHASPALATSVRALCSATAPAVRETRRAVLSMARYLQRLTGRPTPFGLLAGVAPAAFGKPHLRLGSGHRAFARAGADWLTEVITRLEACPDLLARLPVVTNSTLTVRGDRLIVPYRPQQHPGHGAVEVSVRYTAAVRATVDAARIPIRMRELAAKVQAEFPTVALETVTGMLTELITRGALITSLHAPGTEPDALGRLVRELQAADAAAVAPVADLVAALGEIHDLLQEHNRVPAAEAGAVREEAAGRMRDLASVRRHPLAVDLRLDAGLVLPEQVAREAERQRSS